ncbi:MAG: hypothetical protein DME18_10005 [Verrucomicrobia bacterium]|nr:MAG: hypothetical protein DME18_10005 [Verrucomicrobiota bacterium]
MNHPKREEWAPYLFGEARPEARRELAEHLQNCPECAAEIAGWQRSLRKLDRWKLPDARARSSPWAGPVLKWGIAAALLLGAGFGFGRLSAPANAVLKTARAEIEASVKSSVVRELRPQFAAEVQNALVAARSQMTDSCQAQLNKAMAGIVDAFAAETRRQLDEFVRAFNNLREEDRRTTLALFEKIQKQHSSDYLSLRGDLETVASLTDEEIGRARQSLVQLAANKSNQSSKP